MPWNNEDLMTLVPFKVPNMADPTAPHIGYGVAGGRLPIPDMLFTFGGVNANAANLLSAAPLMYQGLSRVAGAMRAMSDEIEAAIAAGHITRDRVQYVLTNYDNIERDCLSLMTCATEGVDAFVKSLGAANARR
ncbi:hypothetical protein RCTITAN_59 [Rhodobacter phage RcTitan]|uniref:Uncharacterized protein n=1 Tax=Rhodobacter phage RcTitan TaxID=1662330 RepID=A0A0K1LLM9_9CAUD|nr:hypothetical protein RCTITAN_59 [Rhodobacter phage RcTitan]AKU43075.1 hypothetical protein RCTITAN_59 [Rhodobacter phage RcTitan]